MIITNPLRSRSLIRAQVDAVSRRWWVLLVPGIISLVAGGIIVSTDWTVSNLVVFIGTLFLVRGAFMTLSIPLDGAARAWSVGLGLLEMAVGVAVWVSPRPTLLAVAAFIGWWILFNGVMAVAGAISGRDVLPFWGLALAFGIVEMLFAFYLLARPGLTLVTTVLAIGLWTMIHGAVLVMLSLEIKHLPRRLASAVPDGEGGRDVRAVAA